MTPDDFRHLETLAQMSHLDHVLASGPVNYDRCDRRLCRESVRVLAALAQTVEEDDRDRRAEPGRDDEIR